MARGQADPEAPEHPAAFERDNAIEALARYSLIRAEPATLAVHRLIQAVTRDALDHSSARARVEGAVQLLAGGPAGTAVGAHAAGPRIADLLPHVLALHEPRRAAPRLPSPTVATLFERFRTCTSTPVPPGLEAEPLFERAIAIGEKTLGPEHPDLATRLNNLAELYRATGRYAEAEPLYQRAIAIIEKTLGPEHPALAT